MLDEGDASERREKVIVAVVVERLERVRGDAVGARRVEVGGQAQRHLEQLSRLLEGSQVDVDGDARLIEERLVVVRVGEHERQAQAHKHQLRLLLLLCGQ